MTGSENIGTGVYTAHRDIDVVSRQGLYASACELIRRHSHSRHVLDLGCSDGVGTYGLDPEFVALGIDFDGDSVQLANRIASRRSSVGRGPTYEAVEADLLQLPPDLLQRLKDTPIDTVVALDVLEHFSRPEAVGILELLRTTLARHHVVIVSMPVLSALSIETYRALFNALRNRQRPPDGLLDRTHQILTGKSGHRTLFERAGYEVVEEYQTDHVIGTSGDWEWQSGGSAASHLRAEVSRRQESGHRMARLLTSIYAAAQPHRVARKAVEGAVVYQGLYVLTDQIRHPSWEGPA